MENKLKIKLSIADRVYPLTVDPSQEEGLRSASKKIEAMIKQFEENYAVRDKQDVLAMCALQFASQVEQKQVDNTIDGTETLDRLKKINDLLKKNHWFSHFKSVSNLSTWIDFEMEIERVLNQFAILFNESSSP